MRQCRSHRRWRAVEIHQDFQRNAEIDSCPITLASFLIWLAAAKINEVTRKCFDLRPQIQRNPSFLKLCVAPNQRTTLLKEAIDTARSFFE